MFCITVVFRTHGCEEDEISVHFVNIPLVSEYPRKPQFDQIERSAKCSYRYHLMPMLDSVVLWQCRGKRDPSAMV